MPTQEQMQGLTKLVARASLVRDGLKRNETGWTVNLGEVVEELTLSVKQLQLEVANLGQQLHNRDNG